jgi:hypothetical protein
LRHILHALRIILFFGPSVFPQFFTIVFEATALLTVQSRVTSNYLGIAAKADVKFWPVPLELSGRVMQLQTLRLAVISQSQKSAYNHMTFLR